MKKYDSYKDSGVEWIGEIPSHWDRTKVKYLGNVNSGDGLESSLIEDEGDYPVYGGNGVMGYYSDFNQSREVLSIGRVGEKCGNVHFVNEKVWINDNSLVFEPNKNIETLWYVFHTLTQRNLNQLRNKNTQPLITGTLVKNEYIPFPPLSEQQQIVSFLDTKTSLIDSLIEKTQRKIELLKEKRTSLINEVVTKGLNPNVEMKDSGVEWIGDIPIGWENGRLGYYSSVFRGSGYQYLNQVDEYYEGGKEKVVRISDITEFNPIWCEYQEQFENYRIQPDNILIGGTGHYFGKSIYVTKEMEGLIHSYNIIRVVVKNQYPKYVQYWLSSSKIREQMDISVLGSGQPFIDIQGLKDLHILIPPLSEQQQIVEYLDEQTGIIDKTISIEEKRIDLLKEYRQSLISEVVTGKRKVV